MFKSKISDYVLNKVEMTFYEVKNEIHFYRFTVNLKHVEIKIYTLLFFFFVINFTDSY